MTSAENRDGAPMDAELLRWSASRTGDEVRVFLVGEIDLSTTGGLTELLRSLVETSPGRVVVDLGGVSFLDSTGIACLINATTKASAAGRSLVVQHPGEFIRRTFELVGVDKV